MENSTQILVSLPTDILDQIVKKANRLGIPLEQYAESLISRNTNLDLSDPSTSEKGADFDLAKSQLFDSFAENSSEAGREEDEFVEKSPDSSVQIPVFSTSTEKNMKKFIRNNADTQSENKKFSVLEKIFQKGSLRTWNPLPSPESFDPLFNRFPNFEEVTKKIQSLAIIGALGAGRPVNIPPILLAGDPGVGKSAYIKALANILGVPTTFIDGTGISSGASIVGLSFTFRSGTLGPVARQLAMGEFANPLFILDEIDKAGNGGEFAGLWDVMHGLLEPVTSKSFIDEGLGEDFPLDASHITWFATCNHLSAIPESLQSRFNVFTILPPTKEKMTQSILPSIYQSICEEFPICKRLGTPSVEDFRKISHLSPREGRKVLEKSVEIAVRRAYEEGVQEEELITPSDQDILIPESSAHRSVGFSLSPQR